MSATPEEIAERLLMAAELSTEPLLGNDLAEAAALIRAQAERVRVLEEALRFTAGFPLLEEMTRERQETIDANEIAVAFDECIIRARAAIAKATGAT